jgi:hypothetical protein
MTLFANMCVKKPKLSTQYHIFLFLANLSRYIILCIMISTNGILLILATLTVAVHCSSKYILLHWSQSKVESSFLVLSTYLLRTTFLVPFHNVSSLKPYLFTYLVAEDKRQNDGKLSEYLAKNMSLRDLKKKKKKKSKSSKPNEGTGDTLCTNKSQEDALLAFKAGITSDPNNVMANWVAGGSVCNGSTSSWSGITCVGGLVTKLKLGT